MTTAAHIERRLQRIERDIFVEKKVRKQIESRGESTVEIDQRIASLKQTANVLRNSAFCTCRIDNPDTCSIHGFRARTD